MTTRYGASPPSWPPSCHCCDKVWRDWLLHSDGSRAQEPPRCRFVFRHVLGNARRRVQELYSGFRRDCRLVVLGAGWVGARAGESVVFVCLPWWSTLRLSSVISGLMNGSGYVMGGSGATSSQLKETDEGPSANQFKKKTLISTSGYKMFFCLRHGCRDGSESVVPPLWSRLKYLYLFISRPDYSGILD